MKTTTPIPPKQQTLLAIDPSIRDMGWCIWHIPGGYKESGHFRQPPTKEAQPYPNSGWLTPVQAAQDFILQITKLHYPNHAVIELPRHFSSATGQAARNSDAILKLIFLVGSLRAMLLSGNLVDKVTLLPVSIWKGNSPKSITLRRVRRITPTTPIPQEHLENHNEVDAIGIARFYAEKL